MSGTLPSSYRSPVDFRISQTPPSITNISDTAAAIGDIYASIQQIIHTLIDFCGIGPQSSALWPALNGSSRTLTEGNTRRFICRADVNISFGHLVTLILGGDGKLHAKLADASLGVAGMCDGFCSQQQGIASGQLGEFTLGAGIITIGGLTVGQRYWLSNSPGLIVNVPPAVGPILTQYIGIGVETTKLWYGSAIADQR